MAIFLASKRPKSGAALDRKVPPMIVSRAIWVDAWAFGALGQELYQLRVFRICAVSSREPRGCSPDDQAKQANQSRTCLCPGGLEASCRCSFACSSGLAAGVARLGPGAGADGISDAVLASPRSCAGKRAGELVPESSKGLGLARLRGLMTMRTRTDSPLGERHLFRCVAREATS